MFLLMLLSSAVYADEWCSCADVTPFQSSIDDVITWEYSVQTSLVYNRVVYTDTNLFFDAVILPMLPTKTLTGIHSMMALAVFDCTDDHPTGTSYSLSVVAPIVFAVITDYGTRTYQVNITLNAACQDMSIGSQGRFTILDRDMHIGPYMDNQGHLTDQTSIYAPPNAITAEPGIANLLTMCASSSHSYELKKCQGLLFDRAVSPIRFATDRLSFYVCSSSALWTNPPVSISDPVYATYHLTSDQGDFVYSLRSTVCGRSVANYMLVTDMTPFAGRTSVSLDNTVVTASCSNSGGQTAVHECSPYDVFLMRSEISPSSDDAAINNLESCPIPFTADCPSKIKDADVKWYASTIALWIGSLGIATLSIYGATAKSKKGDEELFNTNATAQKISSNDKYTDANAYFKDIKAVVLQGENDIRRRQVSTRQQQLSPPIDQKDQAKSQEMVDISTRQAEILSPPVQRRQNPILSPPIRPSSPPVIQQRPQRSIETITVNVRRPQVQDQQMTKLAIQQMAKPMIIPREVAKSVVVASASSPNAPNEFKGAQELASFAAKKLAPELSKVMTVAEFVPEVAVAVKAVKEAEKAKEAVKKISGKMPVPLRKMAEAAVVGTVKVVNKNAYVIK